MCNYIYKELSCQHHYHLVESWCDAYIMTGRRCPPTIVSKQYWGDDICAACRERSQPNTHPCAELVRELVQRQRRTFAIPARPYSMRSHTPTLRSVL